MKAQSLTIFKKSRGISQAQVNRLVETNQVEIQQNGYLGDSKHHYKLVVFSDKNLAIPKAIRPRAYSTKRPIWKPDQPKDQFAEVFQRIICLECILLNHEKCAGELPNGIVCVCRCHPIFSLRAQGN